MREHQKHTKRLFDAIREILHHDWDPIGIADIPEAHDEYDGYVWVICDMLAHQDARRTLIDHLWWVETVFMGLPGDRQHTEEVADRLIGRWKKYEA